METTYNKDIAHCSGYCCLLSDQCRRYHLFRAWSGVNCRPLRLLWHASIWIPKHARISSIWNKRHHEKWKRRKSSSPCRGCSRRRIAGKASRLASRKSSHQAVSCIPSEAISTNGTPSRRRCNGAAIASRSANGRDARTTRRR